METIGANRNFAPASGMERIFAAVGVIGAAACAFMVQHFNPTTAGFFPVCPLYALTGLHCPGCGLTRGYHALFNGDILTALHYNALLPVYSVFFGYLVLSLFLIVVRGRGLSFKSIPTYSLCIFMIVSLAFGVLRNLPFYPFTVLAP